MQQNQTVQQVPQQLTNPFNVELSFLQEIKETTKAFKLTNVVPLRNLSQNTPFQLIDIKKVPSNYYGKRLVAILNYKDTFDVSTEFITTVFLPDRYQRLTDKQIEKMVNHQPPLKMIYKGKDIDGIHNLDFIV
jgi:hypothetical protein